MKSLTPLALLALVLVAADKAKPDTKNADAKKIQGNWTLTSIEADGKEAPLPPEDKRKLKIDADKLSPGDDKPGTYKLGTDGKLKTIDLSPPDGSAIKGLYELNGDMLK